MVYGPLGREERIGGAMAAVKLELQRNLHNFDELIEGRGADTGAWRGTVQGSAVQH